MTSVRIGLAGTGHWARRVHGPGVVGHPETELVAVWGRNRDRADEAGRELGVPACAEFDDLLDRVDAVVFALPPDVQADLALRAAHAGRHLLLEKPVALTTSASEALVAEVEAQDLASVVFFTERFMPPRETWLRSLPECSGGWATWLGSLRDPGNPFAASVWRQERGGLWDVAPHALSVVLPVLGPVVNVVAVTGRDDLTRLLLEHRSGATSGIEASLQMPVPATRYDVRFYSDQGWHERPEDDTTVAEAHHLAVGELAQAVRSGDRRHRCDVRFGAQVVDVLARAEQFLNPR